ncbi:MAG: 2-methylcitrate dehydratase [Halieaceae bacterium]|nr:2-methylcitrate dehydratase [Halieaceae bacterium]
MQASHLTQQTAPLSRAIAERAVELDRSSVPDDVWEYLKLCLADSVGIAFASRHYEFAQKSLDSLALLGSAGQSSIIGQNAPAAIRDAAMMNGLLIHGLDYDDTHLASVVHCSASAFPAALALTEERALSGADLMLATLIAIEIDAMLGTQAGGVFQQVGFHPTGVVGVFGATVAAARLLGGDTDALVRAQGVALSLSSGSMAFLDDGSWTKRLHPGWAASAALQAAALGVSGFEGPGEAYGGRFGFYALYAPGTSVETETVSTALFHDWALRTVAIKPYPICHFNHAPVDSALALRAENALTPDSIESVTILLDERQFGVVVNPIDAKRVPQSEYDAKFSVPYAVATALCKGRFSLADLEDAARLDAEVLTLAQRIECVHDERSRYPDAFSGGVKVSLRDGSKLEHFEAVNRGAEGQLLSHDQVRDKFLDNCALTISAEAAERLWQTMMTLDELNNVSELTALLREEANSAA